MANRPIKSVYAQIRICPYRLVSGTFSRSVSISGLFDSSGCVNPSDCVNPRGLDRRLRVLASVTCENSDFALAGETHHGWGNTHDGYHGHHPPCGYY